MVQCNAAIGAVWDKWRPLVTSGPTKGQRRDQPVLAVEDGRLTLRIGAGRPPRGIHTPLRRLASDGTRLEPHWKHDAWVHGAVPALRAVIDGFLQQLPPGVGPAA